VCTEIIVCFCNIRSCLVRPRHAYKRDADGLSRQERDTIGIDIHLIVQFLRRMREASILCPMDFLETVWLWQLRKLKPDAVMPKRLGSPLEPENARKGSRFFTEPQTMPGQSLPPASDAPTDVQEQTRTEVVPEGPSEPHLLPKSEDKKEKDDIELAQLLSFEELKTPEEIATRFHVIARELFTNYRIRIQSGDKNLKQDSTAAAPVGSKEQVPYTELQLMEIEFYLINPNVHEDPYCHGSMEQMYSGHWSVPASLGRPFLA
jgi:hypothetical protein